MYHWPSIAPWLCWWYSPSLWDPDPTCANKINDAHKNNLTCKNLNNAILNKHILSCHCEWELTSYWTSLTYCVHKWRLLMGFLSLVLVFILKNIWFYWKLIDWYDFSYQSHSNLFSYPILDANIIITNLLLMLPIYLKTIPDAQVHSLRNPNHGYGQKHVVADFDGLTTSNSTTEHNVLAHEWE